VRGCAYSYSSVEMYRRYETSNVIACGKSCPIEGGGWERRGRLHDMYAGGRVLRLVKIPEEAADCKCVKEEGKHVKRVCMTRSLSGQGPCRRPHFPGTSSALN
jgi:hypothetical protein